MVRFSKIGIGGLWIDSKTVVFAYDVRFDLYLGKVSWLFGFDMGLDFGRVEINEGCLEKVRSDNIRHFFKHFLDVYWLIEMVCRKKSSERFIEILEFHIRVRKGVICILEWRNLYV